MFVLLLRDYVMSHKVINYSCVFHPLHHRNPHPPKKQRIASEDLRQLFCLSWRLFDTNCNILVSMNNMKYKYNFLLLPSVSTHIELMTTWMEVFPAWKSKRPRGYVYRQVSNIRRTLVGNKLDDHSDVVGASPIGAAPTTSSFSTQHQASLDWTKKTARRDEKHLSLGIWCVLY